MWLARNRAAVAIAAEVACGNKDSNSTATKLSVLVPTWEDPEIELLPFTPANDPRLMLVLMEITEYCLG